MTIKVGHVFEGIGTGNKYCVKAVREGIFTTQYDLELIYSYSYQDILYTVHTFQDELPSWLVPATESTKEVQR